MLAEAKVGIAAGYTFGAGNEGHVRLCFAISTPPAGAALLRVREVLDRLSMSSTIRRGTSSKLSQNSSIIAAIIRFSAVGPGRFSSRHIVGCEHRSSPLSGSPPTAI